MIPGANVLNIALSVIARQTLQYYQYTSRAPNSVGIYVSTYDSPTTITGSAQPVPHELNEKYGKDFQDNLYRFFVPQNALDVNRDSSGDQIVFNGVYYQVISTTPWYSVDGWVEILAVQVPSP